jgi:flavin reductase ActVB
MSESISSAEFREALARFASGVTVVAARDSRGLVGFTATGFTSVSLSPPLILVCIGKKASVHDRIVDAELFGVSVLAERQAWIAEQFARPGVDRFLNVPLSNDGLPRAPRVEGALTRLECQKHALHDAGDHTLLVGKVLAGAIANGRPLVHFARRFGGFITEGQTTPGALKEASRGDEA